MSKPHVHALAVACLLLIVGLPVLAAAAPPPNGAGSTAGGTNQLQTFQLPLVRTDGAYDTVLHLTNPTAQATTVTVAFYNQNGTPPSPATKSVPLNPWASADLDVATVLAGFQGSASVTASPGAASVSADVFNTGATNDNFDSYPGLSNSQTTLYAPLVINGLGGVVPHFYVRNPSATASASVTVSFWQDGQQKGSTAATIPPLGAATLGVTASTFQIGPVQLTSDQPVVAVAELAGTSSSGSVYSLIPFSPATLSVGGTLFVPRFQYDSNSMNWNSNLVLLNTGTSAASYIVTFYNPDGSVAGTATAPCSGCSNGSMQDWTWGNLPVVAAAPHGATPPVSSGFAGSAVVTVQAGGPVVPLVVRTEGNFANLLQITINAVASYLPGTGSPGGGWGSLAGIRKSAGGESTAFSLMNVQTTAQDYALTYWDGSGSFVRTDTLSLSPNQAWYVSQAADGSLPSGFSGSVQITNLSGGTTPLTVVEGYGGSYSPPPPPALASPTPFPTPTPIPGLAPRAFLPAIENAVPLSTSAGW